MESRIWDRELWENSHAVILRFLMENHAMCASADLQITAVPARLYLRTLSIHGLLRKNAKLGRCCGMLQECFRFERECRFGFPHIHKIGHKSTIPTTES